MTDTFFDRPILNSPYAYPGRHWELDDDRQPTSRIIESRRRSELITPVPKPQKRRRATGQGELGLTTGDGLSTSEQEYNPTPIINEIRGYVAAWRSLPNPNQWQVTPETARLLQHWRHHQFERFQPFFCQIEADFISGFVRESDGVWVQGRFELFRNYDGYGERLARPRTLLIDSEQLESGEDIDKPFREMNADPIERFRRDLVQRTGDARAGEKLSDQDLLREVMNTVGKSGQLGESIRCVVSVSMLTEGWDANTVTHILGVRAFGTQLLCEQVIGRGLRRQSYDLNEENLLAPEYADVLGIPFDFTAKPVVAPPTKPRKTVRVEAVRPDRDALEIRFPRVEGYRVELPEERLTAKFTADSVLELTPELIGPSITKNQGIIGEGVELTLAHLNDMRPSTILYHLSARLLFTKFRDPGDDPKMYLFSQLKRIAREWLDGGYLRCSGGTYPAQLIYQDIADRACERIKAAITASMAGEHPIKAVLDPYNPTGSTAHARFDTSKALLYKTAHDRSHVNYVVCDSGWEAEFCRAAEANPRVRAYVKNQGLGFEVPYLLGATPKKYLPDFMVRVDDGHGDDDLLNLVAEIKGYRGEDAKDKANTMDAYWVPGVNNLGAFGRWAFAEFKESVYAIAANFDALIERAVAGTAD